MCGGRAIGGRGDVWLAGTGLFACARLYWCRLARAFCWLVGGGVLVLGVLEIGRFRGGVLVVVGVWWFWRLAHWLVQALVGWRARGTMAGSFGVGRFRGVIGDWEF